MVLKRRAEAVLAMVIAGALTAACSVSRDVSAGRDSASQGAPARMTGTATPGTTPTASSGAVAPALPAVKPRRVCGNEAVLGHGPVRPPAGAVVVPAGDNSAVAFSRGDTTFWFAPGTHTFGRGQYDDIEAGAHSRYVGAPGAVLDGRRLNQYAFTGQADGVTVEYLVIQNFGAVGSNHDEGVVNHDQGPNWTVRHNTIRWNAGAGVMLGSGTVLADNCITSNGQYGFNAYTPGGPVGITMVRNEISYNNTYDWEAKSEGCGCTGGGKFWSVRDATVTDNYVHHNHGVGLWVDNNNRGFLIARNYIADNADEAIIYETSYNAVIRDNVLVHNAVAAGRGNAGYPTGALYISESGGDSRVQSRYRGAIDVTGNLFRDNWGGVVLWENADRYCGSPANTSTGECTLVDPAVVSVHTCNPRNIGRAPYHSDCRWKTQHVAVHANTFELTPAAVSPHCRSTAGCGFSALFSNYGTYPDWSAYKGTVVQSAITYRQGNRFYDNAYRGPWHFVAFDQSDVKTFPQWQAGPYEQDRGSSWAQ